MNVKVLNISGEEVGNLKLRDEVEALLNENVK